MPVIAAAAGDVSLVFIELGAAIIGLALLARLASRWGFSAIPLCLLAGLAFGPSRPVSAQATAADYARANSLGDRVKDKVFRASVEPHWIAGSDRFWYRNDLPEGRREFVLADPAKKAKRPAFDHARLAAALSKALGRSVEAERLPVERIAFFLNRNLLRVQAEDKTFEADLKTYELRPAREPLGLAKPLPPETAPVSRNGGDETHLTFLNKTGEDVFLYWVDPQGQRREYGTLRAGETKRQHTFAGHTWLVA